MVLMSLLDVSHNLAATLLIAPTTKKRVFANQIPTPESKAK